eukprot:5673564-Prymnesium_polylepis.1
MAAWQARSGRAAQRQRRASACDGCRVAAARCAPQQPEGAMGAQKRVWLRVFRARRSQGVCGRPPS